MIALMILSAAMVYLVIGNFIVKRIPNKWGKWIAIIILILIPTGDSIVGRIYFSYLCSTEAGVKVYQVVELPAEYWDEQGRPRFYDEKNGNLRLPLDSINWESKAEKYPLNLEKNISEIKEKSTGKVLNERVLFTYWGGWLARNFDLIHNTAISCNSDVNAYTNYVMQIFKPATSTR